MRDATPPLLHTACRQYKAGEAPTELVEVAYESALRELLETKICVLGGGENGEIRAKAGKGVGNR